MPPDDKNKQTTETPKVPSAEEIQKLANDAAHAAFTKREQAAEARRAKEREEDAKARQAELDALTEKLMSGFEEKLRGGQKATSASGAAAEPGKTESTTTPSFKLDDHPEWQQTQKELAALKKQAKEAIEREKAMAEERRKAAFKDAVYEALAANGIKETAAQRAALYVLQGSQLVAFADNGKGDVPVFLDDGEEKDLAEGIAAWAATEDGKRFKPAIKTNGSGGTRSGAPPPKQKKTNEARSPQEALAANRAKIAKLYNAMANHETTVELDEGEAG